MHVIKVAEVGLPVALDEAGAVIRAGGVVIYPTETFYAIGVDALDADAVGTVFALKGREYGKPLPVIVHDKAELPRYVTGLDEAAAEAADRLMPGPITLIFLGLGCFPPAVTAGTGSIAVRVPAHEVAAGLARAAGVPITATSANLSGAPGLTRPEEVMEVFGSADVVLLDGGNTPGGLPTTLLDITSRPARILREGTVTKAEISNLLGRVSEGG